jgi:hypothetical protein
MGECGTRGSQYLSIKYTGRRAEAGIGPTVGSVSDSNDNALSLHTADHIRQWLPKIYGRELIDRIFRRPYCRIGDFFETRIAKRQTASMYLKLLVEIGVLSEAETDLLP